MRIFEDKFNGEKNCFVLDEEGKPITGFFYKNYKEFTNIYGNGTSKGYFKKDVYCRKWLHYWGYDIMYYL